MNSITLPMAELKPALTGLGKIINRNAKLPVLNHVKIERTKDGWIGLTTTDLDHFITVRLEQPAQGEPMAMLLSFDELLKTVKSSNKGESILLEPAGKDLVLLKQGDIENRITTINVDEFPQIPKLKDSSIPLPDPLRRVIQEAMQCASEDPARLVLQGAFIDVSQPKSQHIVATDGRHLYNANSWNLPLKSSVIIPKHKFLAWSEFNKDGEWQLKTEGPMLQINSRRWRFITKQIEGKYPDWRKVMPDRKAVQVDLVIDPASIGKLIQNIERMPCHNPEHFTIGLEWIDGRLSLLGKSTGDAPWTKVIIPDVEGHHKNVAVFLNRQLLIKGLEFGLNTISIIDPVSPIRLHQGSREMIVMPLNPDIAPPPREEAPRIAAQVKPAPDPPKRNPRQPQPSSIDDALDQIGSVFTFFKYGLNSLRDLSTHLKGLKRSQRSSEKEIQQVRSKLRSLQDVKF